jgi:hypothetical protein
MEGLFFHNVTREHIFNFLPIISIMSLQRALNPKKKWNIYQLFWKRACQYLEDVGGIAHGDLFLQSVFKDDEEEEGKNIISGGFVLSILLDDFREINDVDIYTPFNEKGGFGTGTRTSNNFIGKMYKELYKHFPFQQNWADQIVWTSHINDYDGISEDIYRVREANVGNKPLSIQNITMKGNDMIEHFDLDFCKNMFTSEQLIVKFPFAVLKKKSTIDLSLRYLKYWLQNDSRVDIWIARFIKYRERGFIVKVEIPDDDDQKMIEIIRKDIYPNQSVKVIETLVQKFKDEVFENIKHILF